MFDTLFSLLQKPVLWQRSTEPFWDDDHISKGMLEAHLNPDWDAASRKHSFIVRSVKWLSSLIPAICGSPYSGKAKTLCVVLEKAK